MSTIQLSDGTTFEINDAEWPEVASSSYGTLRGGAYLIVRLILRRHADGRLLASLEEQVGAKTNTSGQLIADSGDIGAAIRQFVDLRELPGELAEECLVQLAENDFLE